MKSPKLLNSLIETFDTRTEFAYDRVGLSTILDVCEAKSAWANGIEQKLFWMNLRTAIQNEILLDTLQQSERITVS